MIPLRDDVPSRTYPIVNVALIALNILVFLYELSLGPDLQAFVVDYALIPASFSYGGATLVPLDAAAWMTALSSMFLHGGIAHVAGNMLFLWVFGDNVEDRLGHVRYLVFYVVCGLLAAMTHVWADPLSRIPTVGASGAVAGVLGAYLILYPGARVLTFIPIFIIPWFVRIPALVFLGLWFVGQALSGGMYLNAPADARGGVAVMATWAASSPACCCACCCAAPNPRARPTSGASTGYTTDLDGSRREPTPSRGRAGRTPSSCSAGLCG